MGSDCSGCFAVSSSRRGDGVGNGITTGAGVADGLGAAGNAFDCFCLAIRFFFGRLWEDVCLALPFNILSIRFCALALERLPQFSCGNTTIAKVAKAIIIGL